MSSRLLKPADVAMRLQVSRSWVYAAAAAGRIPSIRLGGESGPLRFVDDDVERWLQAAREAGEPGRPSAALLRGARGREE